MLCAILRFQPDILQKPDPAVSRSKNIALEKFETDLFPLNFSIQFSNFNDFVHEDLLSVFADSFFHSVILLHRRRELMLTFLMGTHPSVGRDSSIQKLYVDRIQSRPLRAQTPVTDPFNVICDILLSIDDQACLTRLCYLILWSCMFTFFFAGDLHC
jgi:hypothetical protein